MKKGEKAKRAFSIWFAGRCKEAARTLDSKMGLANWPLETILSISATSCHSFELCL